jgi:hypothetical protein
LPPYNVVDTPSWKEGCWSTWNLTISLFSESW